MSSNTNNRIVLASQSPQRRAILEQLGLRFEVMPSGVEELASGDPAEVVVENARRKANDVLARLADPRAVVIGADTEVVSGGEVLGKPADEHQATQFLAGLAGGVHEVHGGVVVLPGSPALGKELVAHVVTKVRFRALSSDEIASYVATGEWRERAGGYAIQGKGAMLVEAVDGDYLNVVGLSAATLAQSALLRASF